MAKQVKKPTQQEKFWNFLATLFFIAMVILVGFLMDKNGKKIDDIKLIDLTMMALATYRLTRILVFDKIFKLFRDFIRSRSRLYLFFVIREIITCPWCAGVWVALVIVVLFFFVPYGKLFIYLMAISGVASFFVVFINNIGLSTEERQHRVQQLQKESDYTKLSD
jgi:hypothetical protein